MDKKIALGLPTNRGFKPKTVLSLLNIEKVGELYPIIATEGYTISENRNYIVAQAIKAKCDYLLFVDDDMIFPPDTLKRLLAHGKDIIGVLSNSRKLQLQPTV